MSLKKNFFRMCLIDIIENILPNGMCYTRSIPIISFNICAYRIPDLSGEQLLISAFYTPV